MFQFRPARVCALILALSFDVAVAAAPEICDDPSAAGQATELSVPMCVNTCKVVSGHTSEAMLNHFEQNCRTEINRSPSGWGTLIGKVADQALLRCLPLATKKAAVGVYEFVKGLPYLVSHLMDSLDRGGRTAKTDVANTWEYVRTCDQSPECRRAVARNLIQYQNKEGTGGYTISDADVDKQIAGRSLNQLIVEGQKHREAAKAECQRDLADLRRKEGYGGIGWNDQSNGRVLSQFGRDHPHCPGLLKLTPERIKKATEAPVGAKDDPSNIEKLSFLEKLAVTRFCLGEKALDDLVTDFCAEVVQACIPLPLVGPQTSFLKPAVAVAAASAKETASFARTAVEDTTAMARGNAENGGAAAGANEVRGSAAALAKKEASDLAEVTASKAQQVLSAAPEATKARDQLIASHNGRVYVGEAENAETLSKGAALAKNPGKTSLTVTVQNSFMKQLNGGTANKDLVTSLTNLHKDLFLEGSQKLKAKYPGVDFDYYSDFKGINVLLSNKEGLPKATQTALKKDFDALIVSTNKEFAERVKPMGINVEKAGSPDKWFHGGVDTSDLKANLWERLDRTKGSGQGLGDANALADVAESRLRGVETERQLLSESPAMQGLLDESIAGGAIPRRDVFEAIRKADSAEDLAQTIRTRYGKSDFSPKDAERLKKYAEGVDLFSPPIYTAKRETLSFDGAQRCGALSADMCGLGAENMHATARALAKKKSIEEALPATRIEEQRVTAAFESRREKLRKAMGNADCTGDDCLSRLSKTLTAAEKAKLMNSVARDEGIGKIRMSMTGPGVAAHDGVELLYHGEKIEATLRSKLEKVPGMYEKLNKMRFGLDMETVALNQGTVNLVIGRGHGVRLSAQEREVIQQAFRDSLTELNAGTRSYQQGQTILRENKLRFVPGPQVFADDSNN